MLLSILNGTPVFITHEHNSVGRNIAYNMQRLRYELWYTHLFTLKGEVLTTKLLNGKKKSKTNYNVLLVT
jgi:hypothetical protein